MSILGIAVPLILGGLAALHALWGLKIWWPAGNEMRLARMAVGAADIANMPAALACFAVTAALSGGALTALMVVDLVELPFVPRGLIMLVGIGFAVVFLLRGIAGYLPKFAAMTPEEPFRTLDKRFYSPLCIALGVAFAVLLSGVSI